MHDQQLKPDNLSQSAIDHATEHGDRLDQRIVRALETAPEPQIPADFAARIASQLPARRPASLTHYGPKATLAGMLVILAALLILALTPMGHTTFGFLESLLSVQFIALAVWLSVWRHRLR
jgi:hypothetical protein